MFLASEDPEDEEHIPIDPYSMIQTKPTSNRHKPDKTKRETKDTKLAFRKPQKRRIRPLNRRQQTKPIRAC